MFEKTHDSLFSPLTVASMAAGQGKIRLEGELHLLFAFDIQFNRLFLNQLFDQQKTVTLFIFQDRAQLNNEYAGSPYRFYSFLDGLRRKSIYFFTGDSRYKNLGMNLNTWQKFLPHFDYIWVLPPLLVSPSSPGLHDHFLHLYRNISFEKKRPGVITTCLRGNPSPLQQQFQNLWPGQQLEIYWPHTFIEEHYSVKAPGARATVLKKLKQSETGSIVASLLNFPLIKQFSQVSEIETSYKKLTYLQKHSYFNRYDRFMNQFHLRQKG